MRLLKFGVGGGGRTPANNERTSMLTERASHTCSAFLSFHFTNSSNSDGDMRATICDCDSLRFISLHLSACDLLLSTFFEHCFRLACLRPQLASSTKLHVSKQFSTRAVAPSLRWRGGRVRAMAVLTFAQDAVLPCLVASCAQPWIAHCPPLYT